ncbi:MAG: VirB4 family type IV secretion system protein [Blastocatellales bacterium]
MDATAIFITASAATALGLGATLGLKLAPAFLRARREFDSLWEADISTDLIVAQPAMPKASNRRRESSIVGLYRDALRHSDGSYTRAYHVGLEPSVFGDDLVVENRCDALARLLAANKPVGTNIQFRFSTDIDPGQALMTHEQSRDRSGIHPLASILHDQGLQTYAALADAGAFRRSVLTCWVRVPSKMKGTADELFLATLKREMEAQGVFGLPKALAASWKESSLQQVMRRTVDEEAVAFAEVEKTFRLIERENALKFTRFTRDELWQAVYLGHRQGAASIPTMPADGFDIRPYICGETIEASGRYIMHGDCPAAIVSMFTPPQPFITADALRLLSINGALNFRHTIISEFIYPDQNKGIKRLDRRIRQVMRSAQSLTGRRRHSPEAAVALQDLGAIRQDLAGGREAIAQVRFYVVVYGEHARTRADLAVSLRNLDCYCEQIIAEIRKINGADADREEPAASSALYPKSLIGEADSRTTAREISETASSLAPLIPTESEWEGAPRPHTLFSLPTGKLIGVDLFDRQLVSSPLALALAAPRGGKSVLLGRIINDVLATKARACVRAVDFGESFAPLVDVLGGRHLRFESGADRSINVWDYDGLESGELPDEVQIAFVVGDLMQLARVPANDTLAEDILTTLVAEVYRNEVPRNRPGLPKHEPRLSHLVDYLETWPFKGAAAERAEALKLALGQFRGHSFLDSPTHPDFAGDSAFDVYELDSLDQFPERVRESLAYRAAARVLRVIGRLNEDGTRSPTLLVFDEVWKIKDKFPRILDVIKRGARTGGKENVVTILATQAYEDLSSLPDIAKTAGVKIIGKQVGDYTSLVEDSGLAPQAAAAISVINNVAGSHAQFLLVLGSGEDKIVQMAQCDLSPVELWTFTSNPDERNARARVQTLKPEWPLAQVIAWLAANYPVGLTGAGIVKIDESLIP